MAGRERDQDNSIELIASDTKTEPQTTQFMLAVPSINPSNSFSKSQIEAEHDRASLNALKVAFNSLQGFHNEQARKLYSLQRKYNLLQEFVQNTHGNIDLGFLEQNYPHEQSSLAQAAGAYNESQDYHNAALRRELAKNSQTLAFSKQEIIAKNEKINEYDQKLKEFAKERGRLIGDVEALSIVLDQKKTEIATKDINLRCLNEKIEQLQTELDLRNDMLQENERLRQQIELYERSNVLNERDTEKDELRARLRNIQEECQRLHVLYEEQIQKLDAKEKEVTRLHSQCKQFEIENSILQSQRNEGNDMVDSGTNAELEKVLELVKKQSNEIRALKNTAEQQNTVIHDLLSKVKPSGMMNRGEIRDSRIAEGASGHYFADEYDKQRIGQSSAFIRSVFPDQVDQRPVRSEMPSNAPKFSNFSHLVKPLENRPITVSSPQIKDFRVPTGNRSIKPMIAENHQPNIPAVNVIDCKVSQMHVGNVFVDTSSKPPRLRASDSDLTRLAGHCDNVQRNNSSSLSPPGILTRNQDQNAYVNHGAKPKAVDKQGFPARMTQSEVIYGNMSQKQTKQPEDVTKPGSLNRPTVLVAPDHSQKLENRPFSIPEENSAIYNQTNRRHTYESDYENIFQNKGTKEKEPDGARESNRVVYENFVDNRATDNDKKDNETFVILPAKHGNFGLNRLANGNVEGGSDNVNSLKICPSCNREFSRLSTGQFQVHVYECFDSGDDQPNTLHANVSQEDDRSCPMCGETFPMSVPQETFEAHVFQHFGEEPPIERFEIVNS